MIDNHGHHMDKTKVTQNQKLNTTDSIMHTTQKKERNEHQAQYSFLQSIQNAKIFLNRCNNSCRTGFNSCTTESRTINSTIQNRKLTQGSVEITSGNIHKSNSPRSTSEGASQRGIPRKTPTGELRKNPNEKCIPIKSIHQYRTSEGSYRGIIPKVNPKIALSQKTINIFNQAKNQQLHQEK